MKKSNTNYFKNLYENFKEWFLEKEHPHSKLNKTVFIHDALKFIGLLIIFLILYNNISKLNQITLIFIEMGSVFLLITLFFVIRKIWHLGRNLKYWFRGFNHGTKLLIGIAIILLLLFAFFNQEKVVGEINSNYNKIKFENFMPINFEILNFSSFNFSFIGTPKQTYDCSKNKTECKKAISTCEDSILIDESDALDMKITISKKSDSCSYYYRVERSLFSQLEGKSMTCNIPLSKIGASPDSIENLKYCSGSLKEASIGLMGQIAGAFFGG